VGRGRKEFKVTAKPPSIATSLLTNQPSLTPSSGSAFIVTSTVAPVSARMATQRPVTPKAVIAGEYDRH
jgi:hypothetical protein